MDGLQAASNPVTISSNPNKRTHDVVIVLSIITGTLVVCGILLAMFARRCREGCLHFLHQLEQAWWIVGRALESLFKWLLLAILGMRSPSTQSPLHPATAPAQITSADLELGQLPHGPALGVIAGGTPAPAVGLQTLRPRARELHPFPRPAPVDERGEVGNVGPRLANVEVRLVQEQDQRARLGGDLVEVPVCLISSEQNGRDDSLSRMVAGSGVPGPSTTTTCIRDAHVPLHNSTNRTPSPSPALHYSPIYPAGPMESCYFTGVHRRILKRGMYINPIAGSLEQEEDRVTAVDVPKVPRFRLRSMKEHELNLRNITLERRRRRRLEVAHRRNVRQVGMDRRGGMVEEMP